MAARGQGLLDLVGCGVSDKVAQAGDECASVMARRVQRSDVAHSVGVRGRKSLDRVEAHSAARALLVERGDTRVEELLHSGTSGDHLAQPLDLADGGQATGVKIRVAHVGVLCHERTFMGFIGVNRGARAGLVGRQTQRARAGVDHRLQRLEGLRLRVLEAHEWHPRVHQPLLAALKRPLLLRRQPGADECPPRRKVPRLGHDVVEVLRHCDRHDRIPVNGVEAREATNLACPEPRLTVLQLLLGLRITAHVLNDRRPDLLMASPLAPGATAALLVDLAELVFAEGRAHEGEASVANARDRARVAPRQVVDAGHAARTCACDEGDGGQRRHAKSPPARHCADQRQRARSLGCGFAFGLRARHTT
mmetsp:Transcript_19771/g.56556  ORF Transcript_19771/g.56556 Transcript_19771/m.56556 type:complete len:364 (+) Transcript_19771:265-1356(+)